MNESADEPVTLGYACGPPRSMRKKVIVASSLAAGGIVILAAAHAYRASRVDTVPLGGVMAPSSVEWQPTNQTAPSE